MRMILAAIVLMMVIAITANKTLNSRALSTADSTVSENVRLD